MLTCAFGIPGATATLADRLLGKIVQAGPATPCAVWVGAYNRQGLHRRAFFFQRPVIKLGPGVVAYVAPTLLRIAGEQPTTSDQTEACHDCPMGTPADRMYRCVDVAHLRWGSRRENEEDKRK